MLIHYPKLIFSVLIFSLALSPIVAHGSPRVITDGSINEAVEDELWRDQGIPPEKIDVQTTDRVVTLSGKVNNILAKERAARIAETVRGVKAVINTIQVTPSPSRREWEVRDDIEGALLSTPATEPLEIVVRVEKGKVTLSGTVDSWQERAMAEKVAKGIKGVAVVENDITVRFLGIRPDNEIKADIEEKLKWDALVDHALIDVKVKMGEVYLSGMVGSAAEKRQAKIDALVVTGVRSVEGSGLKVKEWARNENLRWDRYGVKSDEEIRQAIEKTLLYDPRVPSSNVKARVSAGVVTLRGRVETLEAKRAAAQDARNTVGVVEVENGLRVRTDKPIPDKKIADQLRNALLRDPYLALHQITEMVIDGNVYLGGTVDTYFEKAQAEEVASRVKGVEAVNNSLSVREDEGHFFHQPYVEDRLVGDSGWHQYHPRYQVKSDAEIKEEIKKELFWSPFVDPKDIKVTVRSGTVQLDGTVHSWSEYDVATENAFEGGAIRVYNNLVVKPH